MKFKDFFIADQLTSLVLVMVQFQFLICFYSHDVHHSPHQEVCASKLQPYISPYLVCPSPPLPPLRLALLISLSPFINFCCSLPCQHHGGFYRVCEGSVIRKTEFISSTPESTAAPSSSSPSLHLTATMALVCFSSFYQSNFYISFLFCFYFVLFYQFYLICFFADVWNVFRICWLVAATVNALYGTVFLFFLFFCIIIHYLMLIPFIYSILLGHIHGLEYSVL